MKLQLIIWLVLIRGGSGKYESYQLGDQQPQLNSQYHPWNHSNPRPHPQPLNLSDHQSPPQQSNLQPLQLGLSLQQPRTLDHNKAQTEPQPLNLSDHQSPPQQLNLQPLQSGLSLQQPRTLDHNKAQTEPQPLNLCDHQSPPQQSNLQPLQPGLSLQQPRTLDHNKAQTEPQPLNLSDHQSPPQQSNLQPLQSGLSLQQPRTLDHNKAQTEPQPFNLSDHQSPPQQSNLQHLQSGLSLQQPRTLDHNKAQTEPQPFNLSDHQSPPQQLNLQPLQSGLSLQQPRTLDHNKAQTEPQPLILSDHQSPPQQLNLQPLQSGLSLQQPRTLDHNKAQTEPQPFNLSDQQPLSLDLTFQQTQSGNKTTANCSCACRKPVTGNIFTCSLPCKVNTIYPESYSKALNSFLSFLAPTACIISLFSIALTLPKMNRFTSLDQQIILISVCLFFISFGYSVFYNFSQHISCKGGYFQSHNWHLSCAAVFLGIYLSELIMSTAWTVQSFLWFQASVLRLEERQLEKQRKKMLAISFFVPLILSWAALQMNSISGDPLTGICYLEILNAAYLTILIAIPISLNITIQIITSSCGYLSFYGGYNVAYSSRNLEEVYEYAKAIQIPPAIFFFQMIMNVLFIFSMIYQSLYQNNWIRATLCNCETAMDLFIEPIYFRHSVDLITAIFVMSWNCLRNSWKYIFIKKEQKIIKRARALLADRNFSEDSESSSSGYTPMAVSSSDEHCPGEVELEGVSGCCGPTVNSYPWKRGPAIRTVPLWNEIRKLHREELEKTIRMRASLQSREILERREHRRRRKKRGDMAPQTSRIGFARVRYLREQPDEVLLDLPMTHQSQRVISSSSDDASPPVEFLLDLPMTHQSQRVISSSSDDASPPVEFLLDLPMTHQSQRVNSSSSDDASPPVEVLLDLPMTHQSQRVISSSCDDASPPVVRKRLSQTVITSTDED